MRKVLILIILASLIAAPAVALAYGTDYRFTGKPFDPVAELYDYGARNYKPDIGRFIQPDPLLNYIANPEKLRQMTDKELNDILTNPQEVAQQIKEMVKR